MPLQMTSTYVSAIESCVRPLNCPTPPAGAKILSAPFEVTLVPVVKIEVEAVFSLAGTVAPVLAVSVQWTHVPQLLCPPQSIT
jgi:hypothetical protein